MYIPRLLQNTRKKASKNIKIPSHINQKSIKNESWSSPGAPSGQRPVFESFCHVFWLQNGVQNGAKIDFETTFFLLAFPIPFSFDL